MQEKLYVTEDDKEKNELQKKGFRVVGIGDTDGDGRQEYTFNAYKDKNGSLVKVKDRADIPEIQVDKVESDIGKTVKNKKTEEKLVALKAQKAAAENKKKK